MGSTHSDKQAMFDDKLPGNGKPAKRKPAEKDLDRLKKVKSWWAYARVILSSSRLDCLHDHNVYDGDSWSAEDKAAMKARGQKAINFNRVKPTCDWLIGSEKKNRIDFNVLPRTSEDAKGAEIKTQVLKYLSDANRLPSERSMAFKDAVISGLGWLEVGKTNEPGEEPIFIDYEDWRNIWYDPLSVRLDLKDCRFIIRRKRVDLDVACAMFPDYTNELKHCAQSDGGHDRIREYDDEDTDVEAQIEEQAARSSAGEHSGRNRIELIECWYRMPDTVEVLNHGTEDIGTLRGVRYRASERTHQDLIDGGYATVGSSIRMVVRCMILSGNIVLQDTESPYNHGRFPFIPVWGYRRKRDNSQYGVVRNLRDIQDDLNKRWSKALHILVTQKVIMDKGAVEDLDNLSAEIARPDGIIEKKAGSEFILNSDRGLAREHMDMAMTDAEYIESVGGVTDEQMGRETNAVSGRAIEARKEQGNIVNSELFDNLRVSTQLLGEILLSLVEQYYTDVKIIRLTNEKNQAEFISLNHEDPITGEKLNDITASKADFVVDETAFSASVRRATFETLMEMLTRMPPEISLNLLDLVVNLSDIPGKDDLVTRIRMVNGMQDPDADPNDPEAQAAMAQKKQQQEAEALFQDIMQKLEMEEKQSVIDKNRADADATRYGVAYDQEKLRIEKAMALHNLQRPIETKGPAADAMTKTPATPATKSTDRTKATKQGVKGIKSDNK